MAEVCKDNRTILKGETAISTVSSFFLLCYNKSTAFGLLIGCNRAGKAALEPAVLPKIKEPDAARKKSAGKPEKMRFAGFWRVKIAGGSTI
jgi:hypothetical protein